MRVAVLAILVLASIGPAAAQDPIVRVTVTPDSVSVGESAQMQVTVLVPTWFAKPPVFPSFELANSVTRLPPNSSYPISERVSGETWSGIVRNYRVFPLMSANFHLGGQDIRVSYANPGSGPITVDVPVPEVTLGATVPPGAEALNPYIAGRSLTLSRQVEGDIEELETGDAVVIRTVVELDGLPAMFLPPMMADLIFDGVSVYADESVVEDGDLARRTEKLTLVFQSGGEFMLPAIEIDWWDTTSTKLATAATPEILFSVAGPVASQFEADEPAARDWRRVVTRVAGAIVFLLVLWRILRWLTARAKQLAADKRMSELYAFKQLEKACKKNEAKRTHHAMLAWLDRLEPQMDARCFARDYGDERLLSDLDALSAQVYRESEQSVDLQSLRGGLAKARKACLASRLTHARPLLPPLNP